MHASVCDIIADVVQNAIEAGASNVALDIDTRSGVVDVTVRDNGKGMDAAQKLRARDPFYSEPGKHDRRRVGLGLPLLLQTAEQTGGTADIQSTPGRGTVVSFRLDANHPDTPPMGDLPLTLVSLMAFPGTYDLVVTRRASAGSYAVAKNELIEALGNLDEAGNITLARHYFESQENELKEEQRWCGGDRRPLKGESHE